jgi:hypothetical protein
MGTGSGGGRRAVNGDMEKREGRWVVNMAGAEKNGEMGIYMPYL